MVRAFCRMRWLTLPYPHRGDRVTQVAHEQPQMIITGERTVPGIWHENYWFRRHEAAYLALAPLVRAQRILEAGCGEGYGAQLLAKEGADVSALDYDDYAATHVRTAYPEVPVVRGNLVQLPFAQQSFDVVVSLQTIEHLWDQDAFVADCMRVLRPGGMLAVSTPNRLTFPPGNIYHPKELSPGELRELIGSHGAVTTMMGLSHGPRITAWEAGHGSIVDAQIASKVEDWPTETKKIVRSVGADDFDLSATNLDDCLDVIVFAQPTRRSSNDSMILLTSR